MREVIKDFKELNLNCDRIFCLGDIVSGTDYEHLDKMSIIQEKMLKSLKIPLRYVIGNHELDVFKNKGD